MQLVPITAADEDLTVRLECDPDVMLHIGGPRSEADVRRTHKHRLALMEKGEAHMYKIVADDTGDVLGTIGIWKIDPQEPEVYEMGWITVPEHQGKGVATTAGRLIIAQARSNPGVRSVHAYPAVANAASNAVAHNIGMENGGEFDNEGFAGVLRCNDWRIDLREAQQRKVQTTV